MREQQRAKGRSHLSGTGSGTCRWHPGIEERRTGAKRACKHGTVCDSTTKHGQHLRAASKDRNLAGTTAIEWTETTWNPVTGCSKITPGCDRCYAERMAERFRGVPGHHFEQGFSVILREKRLNQPLQWRRPRRVFVNSMSDLFHKSVHNGFIDSVFETMERAKQHTFQLLTKRSGRMRRYVSKRYANCAPAPNIWMGVSVEDRARVCRIRHLQNTPGHVRFLSVEPLLEDLGVLDLSGIHWVIVGGESGPGARKMEESWVVGIRDQCAGAQVPFFFKQWGGRTAKAGGRSLEGRTYEEYPDR